MYPNAIRATVAPTRQAAAQAYQEFFTFDAVGTPDAAAPPSDDWRRFDPNFVYRYVLVPGLTVGQVVDVGVVYAARAAEAVGVRAI